MDSSWSHGSDHAFSSGGYGMGGPSVSLLEDPFTYGKRGDKKQNLHAQTSIGFATKSGGATKLPKLPTPRKPDVDLSWGYNKQTPQAPPGIPRGPGRPQKSGRHSPRNEICRVHVPKHAMSATKKEIQDSYNHIDATVGEMLDDRVRELVGTCEQLKPRDATGMYLVIERCHNCEDDHALTTRHNEFQYANLSHDILHYMKDIARDTVTDVDEILCPLHTAPRCLCTSYSLGREVWHNSSRIGAFEVYLLTPPPPPDLQGGRVTWPAKNLLHDGRPQSQGHSISQMQSTVTAGDSKGFFTPRERLQPPSGPVTPETWGALAQLPCGYTATLLYSKLSSKGWPTHTQINKRFHASLPLGNVVLKVFCPTGKPLPSFSVELIERPKAEDTSEPVKLQASGSQGACQIEGVPLQTSLEVGVSHSTMHRQSIDLVIGKLKTVRYFGGDIVWRVVCVDTPGGIAVYSITEDCSESRIPDKARAWTGTLELVTGEMVPVDGRVQLPWRDFDQNKIEPAAAVGMVKGLHAHGYKQVDLERNVQEVTMLHLHFMQCLYIAAMAAPDVLLQIVAPGSRIPLEGIDVEVDGEHKQSAKTDHTGRCVITLRYGTHNVKLKHDQLTDGWAIQRLSIDSLSPKLQLPLPQRVKIWQAPKSIRGVVKSYDIWLAAPRGPMGEDWEPFTGTLACAVDGGEDDAIDVTNGTLTLNPEAAVPLENTEEIASLVNPDDPLQDLAVPAPSVRRLNEKQPGGPDFWTSLMNAPFFLGTHKNAAVKDKTKPPPGLLVSACTTCCGAGVPGVSVTAGKASKGETNTIGQCSLPNVDDNVCIDCNVSHKALGSVPHAVSMNGPTELPLYFDSKVYVYIMEEEKDCKRVYLTAHKSEVPSDAQPFQGRVTTDVGDVTLPDLPSSGPLCVALPPEQVPGKVCPIGALTFLPDVPGFKWFPAAGGRWPPPKEERGEIVCGLQCLISMGTVDLGILKPFVLVKHINGHEFVCPLDEFHTVGSVKKYLAKEVDMEVAKLKVALKDGIPLGDDKATASGMVLDVLCHLTVRVTFGLSDIGVPDTEIHVQGTKQKQKTDSNGKVEILAGCGMQTLIASHPSFGEEKSQVKLIEHHQDWSLCTDVSLYAYYIDPEKKTTTSGIEVWLCTQRQQVPSTSRKWVGQVFVPPEQQAEVDVSGKNTVVTIKDKDLGATRKLPVNGLSLNCEENGYDWFSKEPQLMTSKASWDEIIQKPICVGLLKPSIKVTSYDGQELKVPVDEATSGKGLRAYLAKKLSVALELIQVADEKQTLTDDQVITKGMVLQVLSQLTVRVTCGLSNVGVPSVDVVLDGGKTKVQTLHDGAVAIMATRGTHSLSISHPIFGVENGTVELRKLQETWSFATEVTLFTYAVDPKASKEVNPVEVFFCAQRAHVPSTARPVHGNGKITLTSGEDLLFTLDEKSMHVKIPQEDSETLPGAPVRGLSIQCVQEGFCWCPDKGALGMHDVFGMQESWEEIVQGPVRAGMLKPSVEVKMHTGEMFNLAVADSGTVKLAREFLGKELKRPIEDIALFLDGTQLADNYQLVAKSKLVGTLLAEVTFQIFVPEGVKDIKDCEPLPDVTVLVDGEAVVKSGADGIAYCSTSIGSHDFHLMHPALGREGRHLGKFNTDPERPLKQEILCDVRLYAYMTEPEPDSDGAAGDEPDATAFQSPNLVWVCGSFDQIPDDAKSVDGRIWGTGVGGKEVSAKLGLTCHPTEFVLASGIELEKAGERRENISLSSLKIQCFKADFIWKPKEPSPLAERAQEIGGCEYLRLLQCPVVLGNLLPAFRVHTAEGEIHELPVQGNGTVRECLQTVAKLMGFPADQLRIVYNKKQLKDETRLIHGMDVHALPIQDLMVRVSSACCGEAFDGVEVFIDGDLHGTTDVGGDLKVFTTVGSHTMVLSHPVYPVFGEQGMTKTVEVLYQQKNELDIFVELRMFAYVTEPEPIDEEDQEATGDFGPIFDPSCVWLCANSMHIPDESLPINCCIKAEKVTGEDIQIFLDPEKVNPFVLELTPPGKTMQDISPPPPGTLPQCPMSSVYLQQCVRPGFKWSPKDPSPLVERTAEIGGCEFMRLVNCPVVVGWLKPAVCVQCKDGKRFELPMDTHNEVSVIKDYLADELGLDDASSLQLYTEGGSRVTSKRVEPGSICLLCQGDGKLNDVQKALAAHRREFNAEEADKNRRRKLQQEAEKKKEAEAGSAAAAQEKAGPEAVEVEAWEFDPENLNCEVEGGLLGMAVRYPTPPNEEEGDRNGPDA